MEDIEFRINRDEQGRVTGFTLMGNDKYDSCDKACFCLSFITAQQKRKGFVSIADSKIVFTHRGISMEEADPQLEVFGMHQGGTHSFDVAPEDAKTLAELLARKGAYANSQLRVRHELAWGKGFTLYVKPIEKEGN